MVIVRVYFCPCGYLGVQGIEEKPKCHKCKETNVDWFNAESNSLKKDMGNAIKVLSRIEKRKPKNR